MNETLPSILISGVSTGIGLALARDLLDSGWRVFGTVRSDADARRLEDELGERFSALLLDVTSEPEWHHRTGRELARHLAGRPLRALVHNAGIARGGPLTHQPEEEFRAMMETNVLGVFKLTQALVPLMEPGSRMIMISSVSGRLVTPFVGGYAASKFALEALTDAYRNEMDVLGIRVISVQPGPVKTPIWRKALSGGPDYADTPYAPWMERRDEIIRQTESGALPVSAVIRVVRKALSHPAPASRYLVARNAGMIRLAQWLPDKLKDKLIRRRLRTGNKE